MRTLTLRKAKWISKGYPSIMRISSTITKNQNFAIRAYKCMIFSLPGTASETRTVIVWRACPRGLTWRRKCCGTLSLFFPAIQMGFLMLQNHHCISRAPVMGHSDCHSFVWVTCRSLSCPLCLFPIFVVFVAPNTKWAGEYEHTHTHRVVQYEQTPKETHTSLFT